MGKYFNNVQFPVFDDYKPKYWMDSIKWVFEEEHEKPGAKKGKEEEETATVKDRCVKLVLGYNFDLKKWLIVFFDDNKAPAKEVKKKK